MEMQCLLYGAYWNETFDCYSYNWDQIWLLPSEEVSILQPM